VRDDDGHTYDGVHHLRLLMQLAAKICFTVSEFLKPPHDFEFEKSYFPFTIMAKKKYQGMIYKPGLKKPAELSVMGIASKRRDYAPVVRDIYGGTTDCLFYYLSVPRAIEFIRRALEDIAHHRIAAEKLLITAGLKSSYAFPERVKHKVLADRIERRAPGTGPRGGDRFAFLFVKPPSDISDKEREKGYIETPAFARQAALQIDYAHYISNQIANPLSQMLALVYDHVEQQLGGGPDDQQRRSVMLALAAASTHEAAQKIREERVKALLFAPYVLIANGGSTDKEHAKQITRYFASSSSSSSSSRCLL